MTRKTAEDIKANGLIHPIVLDSEGVLIDGRNRLAACRLAGVQPRFTSLNGSNSVSYILSSNVKRRHLNQGQRAMVSVASNPSKFGRVEFGQKTRVAEELGIRPARISEALAVWEYAHELSNAVIAGSVRLDEAYSEARRRMELQETREEQIKRAESDLAMLRHGAPDLAELVNEERMPLREAMAAWRERDRIERERRERLSHNLLAVQVMRR